MNYSLISSHVQNYLQLPLMHMRGSLTSLHMLYIAQNFMPVLFTNSWTWHSWPVPCTTTLWETSFRGVKNTTPCSSPRCQKITYRNLLSFRCNSYLFRLKTSPRCQKIKCRNILFFGWNPNSSFRLKTSPRCQKITCRNILSFGWSSYLPVGLKTSPTFHSFLKWNFIPLTYGHFVKKYTWIPSPKQLKYMGWKFIPNSSTVNSSH